MTSVTPSVARRLVTAVIAFGVSLAGAAAAAQPVPPLSVPPPGPAAQAQIPILREVSLDQRLGAPIPLDLTFVDEQGRTVRLGSFFGTRPVVLALVYYECPMLCTEVLNGLTASLETLSFTAGKDFEVVVVSFDPGETPALAAQKKQLYMKRYGRPGSEGGWHFLTGREDAIHALTSAAGFHYAYDPSIDQFAHPAVVTVLTPGGQISRYLLGIEYAPRDMKLALVEASDSKIGSVVDQALLFCYHYDPETGKYGLAIMNMVRLGGVMTLAGFVTFVVWSVRHKPHTNAVSRTATGTR
ncbi:MAG TPA: SCO family protein [Vicinamibacterales bacterium]|nr:SCO family protein [Vicinamibacterales bacterium]